jgi:hypothetical protein
VRPVVRWRIAGQLQCQQLNGFKISLDRGQLERRRIMFNNPMNYELLKSMQDELQTADEQVKRTFSLANLVKVSVAIGGIVFVAAVIAQQIAVA